MTLHALLICLHSLVVVLYAIPYECYSENKDITFVTIICPIVDLALQSAICYICWTMGSHPNLSKFELIIYIDKSGGTVIKF